jgi:hypothetical protein
MIKDVTEYLLVERKLYLLFLMASRVGIFIGVGLLFMMPHYG